MFICGLYACTEDRCVGGRPSLCNFSALYQPRDERLESPIMCFMCILCCLEKHLLYITGNMLCVLYKLYLFLIQSVSYQIRKCVYSETGNRGLCLCISTGSVTSQFKNPKLNLSWFPSQMWFISVWALDWNQHLVKVIEIHLQGKIISVGQDNI